MMRVSCKLVLLVGVARHSQSTQNFKFAISLQYFKKEWSNKYDFLDEDKYQGFLLAGNIVFTGHSQACTKYPK